MISVFQTLRGQTGTHVINSSPSISQKAHLLGSVVNAPVQPSTSQFSRSSTPKVISGRPSSAMSTHSVFKTRGFLSFFKFSGIIDAYCCFLH